jgi:hypothetical protein
MNVYLGSQMQLECVAGFFKNGQSVGSIVGIVYSSRLSLGAWRCSKKKTATTKIGLV